MHITVIMKPIHYILVCCLLGLSNSGYSQGVNQDSLRKYEDERMRNYDRESSPASINIKTSTASGLPKFFFNELYGSINMTTPSSSSSASRLGGGIGLRGYFFKDTKVNLSLALEYNVSSSSTYYRTGSHHNGSSKYIDVYYSCISIPLNLQVKIGDKKAFLIEAGFYAEINGWSYSPKKV